MLVQYEWESKAKIGSGIFSYPKRQYRGWFLLGFIPVYIHIEFN